MIDHDDVLRALALAVVLVSAPARADVQLWTEVGAERDVTPRVTLAFDQHLRFDDDVSRVSAVMPEVSAELRIVRWLRAETGYRFEYERDGDGNLVVRHRGDVAVRAVLRRGRLRGELEQRYEEELRPTSHHHVHQHVLRERAGIGWQVGHCLPEASLTVFEVVGHDGLLDKLWLTAGVTRRRHGRETEAFYRLAQPYDRLVPPAHIFGIAFHTEP